MNSIRRTAAEFLALICTMTLGRLVGELALSLWLLVKGVDADLWKKRALQAA